jgi:hypothetical protein
MQENGWKLFSVENCVVHSRDPPSGGNYYVFFLKNLATFIWRNPYWGLG